MTHVRPTRRIAVAAALAAGLAFVGAGGAAAQYPTGPVRIIAPIPPGGPLDTTVRAFARTLEPRLKQTVLVENKPGAGTLIGVQAGATAKPDGYTMVISTASMVSFPLFVKDTTVDALKDFTFVTPVARIPYVLAVGAKTGITSVKELAEMGKAKKLRVAVDGHQRRIFSALVTKAVGITTVEVPFNGAAAAQLALAAGDVDIFLTDIGTVRPLLEAKSAVVLGSTTDQRLPGNPDLPTMRELGVDVRELAVWFGLVVPAATPADVVKTLHEAAVGAIKDPAFAEAVKPLNITPFTLPMDEFRKLAEAEYKTFKDVATELGIEPK